MKIRKRQQNTKRAIYSGLSVRFENYAKIDSHSVIFSIMLHTNDNELLQQLTIID